MIIIAFLGQIFGYLLSYYGKIVTEINIWQAQKSLNKWEREDYPLRYDLADAIEVIDTNGRKYLYARDEEVTQERTYIDEELDKIRKHQLDEAERNRLIAKQEYLRKEAINKRNEEVRLAREEQDRITAKVNEWKEKTGKDDITFKEVDWQYIRHMESVLSEELRTVDCQGERVNVIPLRRDLVKEPDGAEYFVFRDFYVVYESEINYKRNYVFYVRKELSLDNFQLVYKTKNADWGPYSNNNFARHVSEHERINPLGFSNDYFYANNVPKFIKNLT